jgi:hypothetical protein
MLIHNSQQRQLKRTKVNIELNIFYFAPSGWQTLYFQYSTRARG